MKEWTFQYAYFSFVSIKSILQAMYIFDVALVVKLCPADIAQSTQQMSTICLLDTVVLVAYRKGKRGTQ